MIAIHYEKPSGTQIYLVKEVLDRTESYIRVILTSGEYRLFYTRKIIKEISDE